jgi:hypothetical protein
VRALLGAGVRVFFVTHLYDLARGWHREPPGSVLFVRAERQPGGRRTFRLAQGEPLPTSHGKDVYDRVFGRPAGATEGAAPLPPPAPEDPC